MNRLIHEKSPYLLQHADNPVDWQPWGEEAFREARESDRPIFLSIGYSTCHWCHVMARESFRDPEVARLLNEMFVPVKVDREERPDIDGVYMKVCQMLTGGGGWPLTVIMTHDLKPFFAGTYFPKTSRFGQIGMLELLPRIREYWVTRRGDLIDNAEQILAGLEAETASSERTGRKGPDAGVIEEAYRQLRMRYDPIYGGFGEAPKFPSAHTLSFLLRYWNRTGTAAALDMVEQTLEAMRNGGIFDQIGGGFHRYATDRAWIVPHFEKMLYDQAFLAIAYTEAFQATGTPGYGRTAREVLDYSLRVLRSPEGGFYCAEDAESGGKEGKFYLWTEKEIAGALDPESASLVSRVFNIRGQGNFAEEHTRRLTGENILYRIGTLGAIGEKLGMTGEVLEKNVRSALDALFRVREARVHPGTDDKILTDWNGLIIAALARGAQAFGGGAYLEAAEQSARFILERLTLPDGRLLHRYRDGEAGIPAFLDDYAFLIWGLLELYETCYRPAYLRSAAALAKTMLKDFWDDAGGGFYFTPAGNADVPVRRKELYDGAVPSGNSVALLDLLELGALTGDEACTEKAARLTRAFSAEVERMPSAYTFFLSALDFATGPSHEVIISGRREAPETERMLQAVQKRFLPNKVVLLRPGNGDSETLAELAGFTKDLPDVQGETTAYVCTGHACRAPVKTAEELIKLLEQNS